MKIVFASNFLNHHQLTLCKAFESFPEIEFNFIATTPVPKERLGMGYHDMNHTYDFVICAYENSEAHKKALVLCENVDVVIIGSAPKEYIKQCLKAKKLTFKYSERIYKTKPPLYQMPFRAIKYFWESGRHKNLYLLCSSAYTAADYAKTHTLINKAYKWGYFPEVKKYDDIDITVSQKHTNSILWAGRLIDWKHPETAVQVALRLKQAGYKFVLNIIGAGTMEDELKSLISSHGLNDCVKMLGSMSPEKVREYMEQSEIYLFTSNRQEGWGAVLNEAMNSGCAVVASHAIGSVPYLMRNRENGLIYHSGNVDELFEKVKYLLDNPGEQERLSKAAYETIVGEWNAEVAAERLINLSEHLLAGEKYPDLYQTGPCSKAERMEDDWFYE